MSLAEWLKEFRGLHEQARLGALSGPALREYCECRNNLARALLSAQHIAIAAGEQPRRCLGAARVLQADLAFLTGTLRTATRSISSSGFSTVLEHSPRIGEEVGALVRMPGGEPIQARARVVGSTMQMGSAVVAFEWVTLSAEKRERLEIFVFDTVLEQLQP